MTLSRKASTSESGTTSTDSKCPQCGGTGWIRHREDGKEYFSECECRKKQIEESRLRFANIPATFKDMRLKNFNIAAYKDEKSKTTIRAACKYIKQYMSCFEEEHQDGMGLYLYSDTKGSGKTRMAASIANELVDMGYQVKFSLSTEIIQEIKRTWDRDNDLSESKLLDQLQETDILVVDDFGTEQVAGWINDKFYQIINNRYVDHMVTIFTSNYPLDQLEYDDRITNRMKEVSYLIAFPEESVREAIAAEKNEAMLRRVAGR